MLGTVLDVTNLAMNKIDKILCFHGERISQVNKIYLMLDDDKYSRKK